MNMIKTTRKALNMTQPVFGQWLSDGLGRIQPIEIARISEWECGKKSARKNVRDLCRNIAATKAAQRIREIDENLTDGEYEHQVSQIIIESME